ncbi:MAG: type VI secretion system tube protein Hcp [Thaumarchaeota archaeon]|nr:type VI secretion system tube protein Hcp [Nitrososphaerota archaeon]
MRGIAKYSIILAATLGLVVAGTSSSYATDTSGSDPIFMKIADINGETTLTGYAGDIELDSFQFGIEHAVDLSASSGATAGKTTFSPIQITKIMDKTSPAIFGKSTTGQVIPQVDIYFAKTTSKGLQTYAHYLLKNVIISSYSVSSGGDAPTESISLNFQSVQFEFSIANPDGTLSPFGTFKYDLSTNTAS